MFSKDDKQLREFYEQLPLGVLIEDYSDVKKEVDRLFGEGVDDLEEYLQENPDVLFQMIMKVRTRDANDSFLRLFKVNSLQEYIEMNEDPNSWAGTGWAKYYLLEFTDFSKKRSHFGDFQDKAADDSPLAYRCVSWVPSDFQHDWSIVITTHEDITERKALEKKLESMARIDYLTGLLNRREFENQLKKALERISRSDTALALLFIDLDGFKKVNDKMGHEAGDEVLKLTASRIEKLVRKTDIAGRLGGDEFTVILEGKVTQESVSIVAEKLLSALESPYQVSNDQTASISASIGIAFAPDDCEDIDLLLSEADKAMYQAKELGKNQYCVAAGT